MGAGDSGAGHRDQSSPDGRARRRQLMRLIGWLILGLLIYALRRRGKLIKT
jgi:hypothetical protein